MLLQLSHFHPMESSTCKDDQPWVLTSLLCPQHVSTAFLRGKSHGKAERQVWICADGLRSTSGASEAPAMSVPGTSESLHRACQCQELMEVRFCKEKWPTDCYSIKLAKVWIWKELLLSVNEKTGFRKFKGLNQSLLVSDRAGAKAQFPKFP